MKVQTFESIAKDVERVLEICQELGLRTAGSRIDIAAKQVRRLEAFLSTGQRERPWPDFGGVNDIFALIEAMEFGTICASLPGWIDRDEFTIKGKLKKALAGPALPMSENATSNEARNFLFELTVGAMFESRGVPAVHGEHPDVSVRLPRRDILIECKRVFSRAKVADNIERAVGQLESELSNSPPSSYGMVAVDVSRIVNPEYNCRAFWTEAELDSALAGRVDGVVRETKPLRDRLCSRRILGVLYRLVAVGYDRQYNRYVLATHATFAGFSSRSMPNRYAAFRALQRALAERG